MRPKLVRPTAIRLFGFFHLAAIGLVLVNNLVYWDLNIANLTRDGSVAGGASLPYLIATIAIVLPLWLWHLVIQRSNVARWIIVAIIAFWVLGLAYAVGTMPVPMVALTAVALGCQSIAAYCLFRPTATAWFAKTSSP